MINKNIILRKSLVIGLLIIFIGAGILPIIHGNYIKNKNMVNRDEFVIFFDDFNDNEKDYTNWSVCSHPNASGDWWEQNQQTELFMYETGFEERYVGICTKDFSVSLSESDYVRVEWDMCSIQNGTTSIGYVCMKISDGDNWIQAAYSRGEDFTGYIDSNGGGYTYLENNKSDGCWENEIMIFSDRYEVTMDGVNSGYVYNSIFSSNPYIHVEIFILMSGSNDSLWLLANWDNVKISTSGESQLPIADFTWIPEDPGIDETIIFDASDSYDPDGFIELYEWDWDNDGNFEESNAGPNASHSWSSFGSYPVTLRVFDNVNNTDSITKIVNIIDIIVPDNYPTIQDAVDHSEDGYRILVRDGIYEENIVIDVELLILQPFDNKAEVIIDGGGVGNVIKIEDKAFGVDISGFTIKNSGSSYAGILIDSSSNDIWDNEIIQNGEGLKIFEGNANQLNNNVIDSNIVGVNIDENSHGNIVKNNNIESNTDHGILIDELSTGNVIQDNFISDNVDSGLRFEGVSKGNLVTLNDFENNRYGIYCIGSSDTNLFHHNGFVNNDDFNAWDSSVDRWDDDFEGNYWDDYTGVDTNGDGIGDTPYYIPGGDNVDRYPLINPPYSSPILKQQINEVYKKTSSKKEYLIPSILDTIYVPGDYPTIQEAVTKRKPGDTIIVSPDVYEEHVVVDKSLIIMGANADADVIVDGGGESFHVFLITADNVDISGFTIQNTNLGKAGVEVMGNSSFIHGNVFRDCGSGVEIYGRFNKIHDNVIQGNTMSDNHWGVYVSNCFDCRVENNDNIFNNVNGIELGFCSVDILDNVVKYSDEEGIIQQLSDNVLIRDNELSFNGLGGNNDAAAIQILSSNDCIVDNNVISSNYRYGVSVYMSSFNDFIGNMINDNIGCPLLFASQSSDNNILENEITTSYEFGAFVRDSNDNYFSNNDFTSSANLDCITFRKSSGNSVEGNNFFHSPLINSNVGGFRLYSSSFDNLCFHNNFYGGCDASDECGNDFDDACFCGNYWENYQGSDGDGDGIGDVHYDIFGGSRDDYPLMYPWDPPGKPSKPSGETDGKVGQEYSYSSSASDPNNLKICYGWDWNGDSIVDDWTGFFNSGVTGSIGHIWGKGGTFMVSVIAKNEHGQVSDWSDPLEVTMPRSKFVFNHPFINLFSRLINLFPGLKTFLERLI